MLVVGPWRSRMRLMARLWRVAMIWGVLPVWARWWSSWNTTSWIQWRDSMRQCPWIQVVISLVVARVMGTEQMRWSTSVCLRPALVRVRRSWRTCAAAGKSIQWGLGLL